MRNLTPRSLTVALMLLALAACSTDTPTAPERTPAPPPGSGPTTAWNITVTVEPRDLTASNAQPATVTVRVRRASDGAVPQSGATVVVSADLGEFNEAGSGEKTVTVALAGGVAELLYFAGEILGEDTIRAQLENSIGSTKVTIIQNILFIDSVAPSSGPQRGGTRIRISGRGFKDPLRVTLGPGANGISIRATVDAVGEDAQGGFIRAITGEVLSADEYFLTEECDSDGDGTLDGVRSVTTVVGVNVELFPGGEADSLAQAFAYRPRDTSCRDATPGPDPPGSPDADFSFTVNGVQVLFTNESTPDGLTYTWLFGDGATSTEEDPVHTYTCVAPPCDFDVTLRAVNESGDDTITKTVTITDTSVAPPVADFSFADTAPPAGEITFTNLSTGVGPFTFVWDFGDATPTSTDTSPTHVYGAAGTYLVTLSTTNAGGTSSITKSVTVP